MSHRSYPLLAAGRHRTLLEALRDGGLRKIWQSELRMHESEENEHGILGSGMLVINPPWGLDERIADGMGPVTSLMGDKVRYRSDWWVGE